MPLGAELTLLINLIKELSPIEEGIIAFLQMIEGVVSHAEEKECDEKWKEKLQQ